MREGKGSIWSGPPRRVARVRTRVLECLLLVVSGLVPLSACEIYLRHASSKDCYVWPPGLQRVFRPTADVMPGVSGNSRFYINENGLRGDSFSGDQGQRFLALGGSTTECAYLDEEEAWPRLVQNRLNTSKSLGVSTWVGNAGHSGHNTRNHTVQLPALLDQYPRIDTVLLLVGVNDMLRRLALDESFAPSPRLDETTSAQYDELMAQSFAVWPGKMPRHPFAYTLKRLRQAKLRIFGTKSDAFVQDEAGQVYEIWREHRQAATVLRDSLPPLDVALDEYVGNLEELIAAAQVRGVRVIFMTQPTLWHATMEEALLGRLWLGGVGRFQESSGHEYYSVAALATAMARYNDALVQTCAVARVECIDLAGSLPKDAALFYDGVHFSEEGARRVAAAITAYLGSSAQLENRFEVRQARTQE